MAISIYLITPDNTSSKFVASNPLGNYAFIARSIYVGNSINFRFFSLKQESAINEKCRYRNHHYAE